MKRCQVKKGFFVLKECGDVAVAQCKDCKKNICIDHTKDFIKPLDATKVSETPTSYQCLECFVKTNEQALQNQYSEGYVNSTDDMLWYYYTRRSLHNRYRYTPFSDYDSDSFDAVGSGDDFEDDGSASFYDS